MKKIKNKFLKSLVTSALSILPMIAIIFILSLSNLTPIAKNESITLGIGAVVMIIGLALFQIGSQNGLAKVGEYMGASLSKQKKLFIVILFSLALGALITCAEPSILIVSSQVSINKFLLIGMIAIGVGIFVAIGVIRIFMSKSLKVWYILFYFIVFALICLIGLDKEKAKFLPFIFDAGGITTGSATVPFILALGAGVAAVRGGKKSSEESFGLVGLASVGPIISMAILILASKSSFSDYSMDTYAASVGVFTRFKDALLFNNANSMGSLIDVALALAPILLVFGIYNAIFIKLPKKEIGQLAIGFAFSYIGLVLFLMGVGAAMSPVGFKVGSQLAAKADVVVFAMAFAIGLVTILCEPAVHSLTSQIEFVSAKTIRKPIVLITLSLGVGVAILLAAIRTVFNFSIMYYLVPGYTITLVLMFFTPNLFTAIAFDSGGTASGPMSVSFVVPMMVGIASFKNGITEEQYQLLDKIAQAKYNPDLQNGLHCLIKGTQFYEQSFGVVALIALTPIIAIQILGLISQGKKFKRLKLLRDLAHDESNAKIITLG